MSHNKKHEVARPYQSPPGIALLRQQEKLLRQQRRKDRPPHTCSLYPNPRTTRTPDEDCEGCKYTWALKAEKQLTKAKTTLRPRRRGAFGKNPSW